MGDENKHSFDSIVVFQTYIYVFAYIFICNDHDPNAHTHTIHNGHTKYAFQLKTKIESLHSDSHRSYACHSRIHAYKKKKTSNEFNGNFCYLMKWHCFLSFVITFGQSWLVAEKWFILSRQENLPRGYPLIRISWMPSKIARDWNNIM